MYIALRFEIPIVIRRWLLSLPQNAKRTRMRIPNVALLAGLDRWLVSGSLDCAVRRALRAAKHSAIFHFAL